MNNLDLVQKILENGYIQIDDFFDDKTFRIIKKFAQDNNLENRDIIRNFAHPAYKASVTNKIQTLLLGIAKSRLMLQPQILRDESLITEENISISFARKGPSFGNSKIAVNAFHYDGSFVNAVITFTLPQNSSGNGLMMYKNLKSKLGMGFIAKICSRLIGRVSIVRKIFKPIFVPYKVGTLTLFFGDVSLHGVGDCLDGDRISLAYNMEQVSLSEFQKKYNPHYLKSQD